MKNYKKNNGISAIILACGYSKRCSKNKLKLKIDDKEIFKYIIDLIYKIDFNKKIIVTNDNDISKYAQKCNIQTIENLNVKEGKSSSIKTALDYVNNGSFMVFVSDQPFLTIGTIEKLIECYMKNSSKIIYPIYGIRRGSPVIFPNKFRDKFYELKGEEGGSKLIDDSNSVGVIIEREKEGVDIDTIEEYEKYVN